MKNIFKIMFLSFILTLSTISTYFSAENAYAKSETISNLKDLEIKIKNEIQNRITNYRIEYTGNTRTLKQDINTATLKAYESDDYLHYVFKGYSWNSSTTDNGVTTITFQFKYLETKEQSSFVENKVKEVLLKVIKPNMTDLEKEKAIHDWIVKNVSYDTSLRQYSAYAALTPPYKTVCQGYALLTYKMLTMVGIENRIIEGYGDGQSHAWNLVKLNNDWYHLDVTFDDPIPDVPNKVSYNYYNLTDAQIAKNHSWKNVYNIKANKNFQDSLNENIVQDPNSKDLYKNLLKDLEFNYLLPENTVTNLDGLVKKFNEATKSKKTQIVVRYQNANSVTSIMLSAIKKIHNTSVRRYTYTYSPYFRGKTNDIILTINLIYR